MYVDYSEQPGRLFIERSIAAEFFKCHFLALCIVQTHPFYRDGGWGYSYNYMIAYVYVAIT